MNFLQLCKQFKSDTGTHGDLQTVTGHAAMSEFSRIVAWVARAYREICNKWQDWRFLFAEGQFDTLPDTSTYTAGVGVNNVPNDVWIFQEDSFRVGTENKALFPIHYDDWRRDRPDQTPTGEPSHFIIKPDRSIILFPTPDDIYTIYFEYQQTPNELVADGDLPLFPAQFHDVILHRAIMYWARYEEAPAEYQQAAQDFAEWMLRLEANQLPTFENAHGRSEGIDIRVVPE